VPEDAGTLKVAFASLTGTDVSRLYS